MRIVRKSPFTGKINVMDLNITQEQLLRYQNGALLQNAFPHLSAGEREFLKTGITPEEWDATFPPEDA
jgi:hypothetical protein